VGDLRRGQDRRRLRSDVRRRPKTGNGAGQVDSVALDEDEETDSVVEVTVEGRRPRRDDLPELTLRRACPVALFERIPYPSVPPSSAHRTPPFPCFRVFCPVRVRAVARQPGDLRRCDPPTNTVRASGDPTRRRRFRPADQPRRLAGADGGTQDRGVHQPARHDLGRGAGDADLRSGPGTATVVHTLRDIRPRIGLSINLPDDTVARWPAMTGRGRSGRCAR